MHMRVRMSIAFSPRSDSAEPDVVGVEAPDRVAVEAEHLGEDELPPVAALLGDASAAGRDDRVALLDQSIEDDGRAAFETLVFDLGIEGLLSLKGLVAMQRPHHVVR